MKSVLLFLGLAALVWLQGCGGGMIKHDSAEAAQTAPAAKVNVPVPVATANKTIKTEKDLTGYWVGAFRKSAEFNPEENYDTYDDANKINLSIDSINGGDVIGHSVVAGNLRPFKGTIEHNGDKYEFLVKEPGTDQYDGAFSFSIGAGDSVLVGTWKAFRNVKTPTRYFNLTKQFFKYDADMNASYRFADTTKRKNLVVKDEDGKDYTDLAYAMSTVDFNQYNASARLLTSNELANLKAADLLVIRNSIYARHGYSFKKPALRTFFDRQYWYIPVSTDVTAALTATEKQNIALLLRYEKNAKEYYDTFGR